MSSTYTCPLSPHPPSSTLDNLPHLFDSSRRGPNQSTRSRSMQAEPFNCAPPTAMLIPTLTPSTYQLQTVDNVPYYHNCTSVEVFSSPIALLIQDPASALLAQWGCDTDRYLPMVPDSHPPVLQHPNAIDGNQFVPVNRTDPQSGCGVWLGSVGSAHLPWTYQAPVQSPAYSPIGYGPVHPNTRQAERRRRALDVRYVNAAKAITKIMSGAHASQYFRTILTDDVATHRAKLNAYIATLDLDVQAWIINCQSTPPSHRPEKCKDKKKNEDYDRLFCCLWCNSTFTVKHNLANHIRSHMDLHISFCDYCDFSSVCSTLPTRHKCTT
ncbi:hypothetical protein BJ165DRAFT_1530072 [Panaeolus papilionaceus]|nr:hypothetical protein BJ165DRAFT_1530072 [Panaeolus papilionaceus]